jgi:hypothetical protein
MGWYEILKDFSAATVALIGVIVTGCFAFTGLRTFDRWKREKLEEKRIDVAIDALAIGFEASVVFDEIRSRFLRVYESADLTIDGASKQQRSLYAVLKRVEAKQPFFDKALSLEPKFVAVFGRDKDGIFELLFSARRQVIVTAETLIEDYRIGLPELPENAETRAQRVKWRKQIFASPGTVDPEDEVGKLLQRFRDEIGKLCRPIVNRSF